MFFSLDYYLTAIRCTAKYKHIYNWAVLKHGYSMQLSPKNVLQALLIALWMSVGEHALQLEIASPVEEGADVEIKCSGFSVKSTAYRLSINYISTVIWEYKIRKSVISDEYDGRIHPTSESGYISDVTITLTNVTIADNGSYACAMAEDGRIEEMHHADLIVHVPPRSMRVFMVSPPPHEASKKRGAKYNPLHPVNCTFFMYPGTINVFSATIKDTMIKAKATYSTFSETERLYYITLHANVALLQAENGKPLTCEVIWTKTQRKYSASLTINVTFQSNQDITLDPPLTTKVTEGDSFGTTCRADNANPPIVINWTVGEDNITEGVEVKHEPGDHYGMKTNSTLWLTARREISGKDISCCHQKDCPHRSVDVLFPPSTSTMNVDVSYHENGTVGSVVNVTCTTDIGNPKAKIVRDFPGKEVKLLTESLNVEIEDDNENKYITSFFSLEVTEENFTQAITCGVKWEGVLFIALNRSYFLGDEMTTMVPSMSSSTIANLGTTDVTGEDQKQTTADVVTDALQASTAAAPLTTAVIIGIALGVGCGVLLVTVIILVVVLVRRRKVRSNDIDAKDTDHEKRLSAHVYDDIDEASGDGNVSKQDHIDGLYDEIQQDNSNTQLPKDKLKDKAATTTNGPVTSLPTTAPTPSLDIPDANGVVYAVVSKPAKTPTASAPEARKSKANSISSVLDTDVPGESKAIKVSSDEGSPPDLNIHKMDKSVNEKKEAATEVKEAHSPGAVSGKEPVAVASESNKKKGKPKKPPKKPKPSTGKSQEKQKEKPAHSKKKGSKSNDENIHSDENVYYNTLDVVLNGSSPDPKELVPERPQKRTESKNKSSKVDDTPREYYNTRDEILHKPPIIDDAYCEISTEPPSNVVKDHGADYAEVSDNLDMSARSVSSKHRSSYHTVDFGQSDGGDDDGDSGGEDIDSD